MNVTVPNWSSRTARLLRTMLKVCRKTLPWLHGRSNDRCSTMRIRSNKISQLHGRSTTRIWSNKMLPRAGGIDEPVVAAFESVF